jgi:hypothetical protein
MSMRMLGICAVAMAIAASSAHADIYTWIDKKGLTNLSNLPPPEGARVTNVSRLAPKDAAREAAARESARQAEMRALNDRVQQLQAEVEQTKNAPPLVLAYAPPPAYAPPAAAPYIINVMQPQAAPASGGCDYAWGDCGFGAWPGYYGSTVVVGGRGRNGRRNNNPPYQYNGPLIPPLVSPPPPPRAPGPHPLRP